MQWGKTHYTLFDDVVDAKDKLTGFEGQRVKDIVPTRSDMNNLDMHIIYTKVSWIGFGIKVKVVVVVVA